MHTASSPAADVPKRLDTIEPGTLQRVRDIMRSDAPLPARLRRLVTEVPLLLGLLNSVTPVALMVFLSIEMRQRVVNMNTGAAGC